ncbi:hypothetical protein [Pseudomonas akapageensis]|uniref:hypothetical protein n=1 Tax=Pseudomonas akapageensis TaxID=2609961 RepID=UPI001407330B|nr:hypothetical protein [Pseudomonas akapageensis]
MIGFIQQPVDNSVDKVSPTPVKIMDPSHITAWSFFVHILKVSKNSTLRKDGKGSENGGVAGRIGMRLVHKRWSQSI